MKKELTDRLAAKYPLLFRDLYGDYTKTCMSGGIECGDGWYDIIDNFCAKVAPSSPDIYFTQIKEKFGTIRLYMNFYNEVANEADTEAEKLSEVTCETCGKPGEMQYGSWLFVACDEHKKK